MHGVVETMKPIPSHFISLETTVKYLFKAESKKKGVQYAAKIMLHKKELFVKKQL
jgi:hypothetical protein